MSSDLEKAEKDLEKAERDLEKATKEVADAEKEISTFAVINRDHILTALKKCNGKISGKGGAAELLRIPPSTLSSKMKRLGIQWPPIPTKQ